MLHANRAGAQELPRPPEGSAVITEFWEAVVGGVGSDVGGLLVGWALSAIGISGSDDQEIAELANIVNLLERIEAELSAIETDFEDLKCEQAQNAPGLTNAITVIGGLYDRYTDYVHNYARTRAIPAWQGELGVQVWLDDIFNPTTGVQAQLIAMQHALTPPAGTGAISECVEFIIAQYQQSGGPTKAVFDWTGDAAAPGVYDIVQQLTDYYYLYQTWAAVLLVEAYHVQACLDREGGSLGDARNCTFGGTEPVKPQDGVTSNTASAICARPANNQVAGDCVSAQSALTNLNNNGAYDGLRQQLIAAGAPYSNVLLGKIMTQAAESKEDLIYPKSLEDFTNNATRNGTKIQATPCPVPLTSATPCGFTAGPWFQGPPAGTTYGTVADARGKVLFGGYDTWRFGAGVLFEGSNLATLLAHYNAATAGDSSGSLGQWMASIGFIDNADPAKGALGDPRLKIVHTGEVHASFDPNRDAVCLIDTNIDLHDSQQPWCSEELDARDSFAKLLQPSGNPFSCGPRCLAQMHVQAGFTSSSAAPGFYTARVQSDTDAFGTRWTWSTLPGWTPAANSPFVQFHWPSLAIQQLPSDWCTVSHRNTPPQDARNPGGVLTMCGPDLEAWLELELPKPPVARIMAVADTTLYRADRSRNDGAGAELTISAAGTPASGHADLGLARRGANRLAVRFEAEQVQTILDAGALGDARLVLTPAAQETASPRRGTLLAAYPLVDAFVEGNGSIAAGDAGAGPGATWNCAVDPEIGDDVSDCELDWTLGPRFAGPAEERPALSTQESTGPLVFDVLEHVASGITAWIIEPFDRRPMRGRLAYLAREGADELGDVGLAPTLVLTFGAADAPAIAADADG